MCSPRTTEWTALDTSQPHEQQTISWPDEDSPETQDVEGLLRRVQQLRTYSAQEIARACHFLRECACYCVKVSSSHDEKTRSTIPSRTYRFPSKSLAFNS
ncbi:hypothetical protein A0H81_06198 [Grifola frondosa]|uniref:Uncharacterized protein n=1 Tax=Grifola frondosa TaxID=5627 RepID=A0A1C7MBS4_GRIFR|nr:hypothetical protein A0H81_06198 [Grifola frondosa]